MERGLQLHLLTENGSADAQASPFSHVLVNINVRSAKSPSPWSASATWVASVTHTIHRSLLPWSLVWAGWVMPTLLFALRFSASFMPALWRRWDSRSLSRKHRQSGKRGRAEEPSPLPSCPGPSWTPAAHQLWRPTHSSHGDHTVLFSSGSLRLLLL